MSTGLYEELGITKGATPEEVRKAYKKKALLTHPDRLPQGATEADKAASEEKFRKVNNAYEVLSDAKKRKEYDTFGIWPPPEDDTPAFQSRPSASHHSFPHGHHPSRSHTFPDPMFTHHSHFPPGFTDPFTLFESIFAGTPFARGRASSSSRAHNHFHFQFGDPFDRHRDVFSDLEDIMNDMHQDPFRMHRGFPSMGFGGGFPPMLPSFSPMEQSRGDSGRWTSESYVTSTVNGVTQTIHKRVDREGNEHVTRTLPDGQKIRTVNGIEQGHSSKNRRLPQPEPLNTRYLPPSGHSHSRPVASSSRMGYGTPPSPVYPTPGPPPVYREDPRSDGLGRHRSRRNSEKFSSSSHSLNHRERDDLRAQDDGHRKHWWSSRH